MSSANSMEKLVEYVIQHNTAVIEGLLAAIMVGSLFLAYRGLVAEPLSESSGANLKDLEETIKKLLDKAAVVPTPAEGGPASPELLAQIEALKTDLANRQAEIELLKSSANKSGGMSDEEKSKLDATINELQAKLAEYEIISEDIADLSMYKEENVKLKKEIEGLKAGGVTSPAVAAAPAPAQEAPAAAPPTPPTPAPAPVAEAAPAAAPAAPATGSGVVDDDIMAEFARAIEEQRESKGEAPAVAAPQPAAPEPVVEAAPAAPTPTAPSAEAASAADLMDAQFNVDKILNEAQNIDGAPVPDAAAVNALEENLNEEKLIAEATALDDKAIMTDFENHLKKGE